MLESLTSCEITYATQPILLVIAALIALFSLSKGGETGASAFLGGMMIAGVFVAAYNFARKQVICLKSPSASIKVDTSKMSLDVAKRFIDTAEKAQADWLKS